MIDDGIVDLVNRDVDGVTTREEHAQVVVLRTTNKEIDRLYDGLLGLSRILAPPEPVDPPRTLKSGIMGHLETPRQGRAHPTRLDQVKAFVRRQWSWHIGVGFASGLAVGGVLMVGFLGPLRDSASRENDLVGTMLMRGATEPLAEGRTIGILHGGTQGEITTSYGSTLCLLRFSLHSGAGTSLELLYDPSEATMSALYSSPKPLSRIEVQNGRIVLAAGFDDTMSVVFAVHGAGTPALRLKITDAGGDVAERLVPLTPSEGE
jgi:hypothetical protein